jgi:hypothetical protein
MGDAFFTLYCLYIIFFPSCGWGGGGGGGGRGGCRSLKSICKSYRYRQTSSFSQTYTKLFPQALSGIFFSERSQEFTVLHFDLKVVGNEK